MRVHAARRITCEREARRGQGARHENSSGQCARGPANVESAEPIAEALLDLGQEARIVELAGWPAPRVPSSVHVMQDAVAAERQDGERTAGKEMLDGAALVRALVRHRGDDADLGMAPAHSLDAGRVAQRRVPAIGGDEQARAQLPTPGQRQSRRRRHRR